MLRRTQALKSYRSGVRHLTHKPLQTPSNAQAHASIKILPLRCQTPHPQTSPNSTKCSGARKHQNPTAQVSDTSPTNLSKLLQMLRRTQALKSYRSGVRHLTHKPLQTPSNAQAHASIKILPLRCQTPHPQTSPNSIKCSGARKH